MILNIRGTSGSGKTHLVRELMAAMTDVTPIPGTTKVGGLFERYAATIKKPKDLGYTGRLEYVESRVHSIYHHVSIVGRYETACGGCDTIKTQDEICDRVRAFSTKGDVVFEGLLVSVLYERYAQLAMELSATRRRVEEDLEKVLGRPSDLLPPFIFAFLDTPEELCVERVKARRIAAGNDTPLNEANTREKWGICQRVAEKLGVAGLPVVWLNHEKALPELTTYLKGVV